MELIVGSASCCSQIEITLLLVVEAFVAARERHTNEMQVPSICEGSPMIC